MPTGAVARGTTVTVGGGPPGHERTATRSEPPRANGGTSIGSAV
jgi:hypothetical protein